MRARRKARAPSSGGRWTNAELEELFILLFDGAVSQSWAARFLKRTPRSVKDVLRTARWKALCATRSVQQWERRTFSGKPGEDLAGGEGSRFLLGVAMVQRRRWEEARRACELSRGACAGCVYCTPTYRWMCA